MDLCDRRGSEEQLPFISTEESPIDFDAKVVRNVAVKKSGYLVVTSNVKKIVGRAFVPLNCYTYLKQISYTRYLQCCNFRGKKSSAESRKRLPLTNM